MNFINDQIFKYVSIKVNFNEIIIKINTKNKYFIKILD